MCQSTANIVKISPKLRFLDDHNSKNTRLMWLKFGVAKLLYICIDLTKFKENPEGLSFFCVDLTWNDPIRREGQICAHKRAEFLHVPRPLPQNHAHFCIVRFAGGPLALWLGLLPGNRTQLFSISDIVASDSNEQLFHTIINFSMCFLGIRGRCVHLVSFILK